MPYFSANDTVVKPKFYPAYYSGVGLNFNINLKKSLGLEKEKKIPKPPPPDMTKQQKMVYDFIKLNPGDVKVVQKTDNMMIIKRDDGYFYLQNADDSGWMEWDDWYTWKQMLVNKKYREAQRLKVGYRAKADQLLVGSSKKDVVDAEKNAYTVQFELQKKEARKKGVSALGQKSEQFLKQHGGKLMMAVGTVATVIPVVGWIAGPALAIAGKVLDNHQTAQYAAKIAKKRQKDLLALKTKFEKGEISEDDYKNQSQKIFGEEIKNIVAEEQALESQQIQPQYSQQQPQQRRFAVSKGIEVKKEQFPTGVAVGGGIAVAGLALALVIALVATRR